MAEKFVNLETGSGTVQRISLHNEEPKFTLTEPDQIDDGNGDWGFTILADKDVFLATVSYPTQAEAIRGRIAMAQALKEAVFVATSES